MNLKTLMKKRTKEAKPKALPASESIVHPIAGNYTSYWVAEPPCDDHHVKPLTLGNGTLYGLPGKMHDEMQNKLDTNIWLASYRAPELMYYRNIPIELPYDQSGPGDIIFPIVDRKAPTIARMTTLLDIIKILLDMGQAIGVSCQGGHGRTGTVIACVYGHFNPQDDDPAETVRESMCSNMIESIAQEAFICEFLGKPESERLKAERAEINRLEQERIAKYGKYSDVWNSNRGNYGGWPGGSGYYGSGGAIAAGPGGKTGFGPAYDWAK